MRRARELKRYLGKKASSIADSSSCFDSGVSLACESVPSHSKVTHWLESRRCASETEREWKNSSTSPVLSRSSSSRKPVAYSSSRSGVLDPGTTHWPLTAPQPVAHDPTPDKFDATKNLIEARRRLLEQDDGRPKSGKSKTAGRSSFHETAKSKMSFRASDTMDDGISHRKQSKKSCSSAESTSSSMTLVGSNSDVTVIGYSYGRGSVPYKSRFPGKNVTLRQFKSLLNKKGNFRYFFKRISDDFGTGVVLEEVIDDYEVLPLWEGKVFCVIESMDDNGGYMMNDE